MVGVGLAFATGRGASDGGGLVVADGEDMYVDVGAGSGAGDGIPWGTCSPAGLSATTVTTATAAPVVLAAVRAPMECSATILPMVTVTPAPIMGGSSRKGRRLFPSSGAAMVRASASMLSRTSRCSLRASFSWRMASSSSRAASRAPLSSLITGA